MCGIFNWVIEENLIKGLCKSLGRVKMISKGNEIFEVM